MGAAEVVGVVRATAVGALLVAERTASASSRAAHD